MWCDRLQLQYDFKIKPILVERAWNHFSENYYLFLFYCIIMWSHNVRESQSYSKAQHKWIANNMKNKPQWWNQRTMSHPYYQDFVRSFADKQTNRNKNEKKKKKIEKKQSSRAQVPGQNVKNKIKQLIRRALRFMIDSKRIQRVNKILAIINTHQR